MAKQESLSLNMKIGMGILVIIVLIGGYYLFAGDDSRDSDPVTPASGIPSGNAPIVSSEPSNVVEIRGNEFSKTEVVISAGQNVTWVNRDSVPHGIQIISPTQTLQSHKLLKDYRYTYTFRKAGVYNFNDYYYPDLIGTVKVL